MTDNFYFAEGRPFAGRELERLKAFLKERGLDYDDKITYTACIIDENTGDIAATGSMSGIILKCVAVSQNYHGQGLLNDLMSKLYETMYSNGRVHFVGFTKPDNLGVFSHMGLYPVVSTEHIVFLENRKDEFKKYLSRLKEKSVKYGDISACIGAGTGADWSDYNVEDKAGARLYMEELDKCKEAGSSDQVSFPGYLIPPEQMPTYFIKDKNKALQYRQEVFDRVKYEIQMAIGIYD